MIKIVCDCGKEVKIVKGEIKEASEGIECYYGYNQDEGEYVLYIECECGNEDYIV